jgi:hypothetical protein
MDPEMEGEQQQEAAKPAPRLSRPDYTPPPPRPTVGRPVSGGPPPDAGPIDPGPVYTAPPSDPGPPPPAKSSPVGKVAAVLVLAGALFFGYNYMHKANTGGDGTSVTMPDKAAMLAAETQSPNYQKHKNANPATPMSLSPADFNQQATSAAEAAAQAGQPIPGLDSASAPLVEAIKKHDVKFITVRAYDTCAEDGDWVTLTTDAGSKIGSFMLTIVGRSIVIPVVGGQLPHMTLTGDRDGVGGITVGIESSGGTWYSGILAPGDTQPIPLVMQ